MEVIRGFERVNVSLSGWPTHGYDRQHPDGLPPNEEGGGWAGMRRFFETCRELGFVCWLHDQYRDYYPDAPSFNRDLAVREEDATSPPTHFPGTRFHPHDWKDGAVPMMNYWQSRPDSYPVKLGVSTALTEFLRGHRQPVAAARQRAFDRRDRRRLLANSSDVIAHRKICRGAAFLSALGHVGNEADRQIVARLEQQLATDQPAVAVVDVAAGNHVFEESLAGHVNCIEAGRER